VPDRLDVAGYSHIARLRAEWDITDESVSKVAPPSSKVASHLFAYELLAQTGASNLSFSIAVIRALGAQE
jgi:hypothetical protein